MYFEIVYIYIFFDFLNIFIAAIVYMNKVKY